MAGGGVAAPQRQDKGKGGRRKKRRLHIRIDMTPMVDIVMLLLIFYMVTTVFSMPQAMEINLPPENETEEVEVKESNLLTIRVDADNRFFWNIGNPAKNMPQLIPSSRPAGDSLGYRVNSDSLRKILVEENTNNPRLSTLILINPKAKYNSMVDILDEIDLLERSWNAAIAKQKGVDVDKLTKDEKFSYRYAMGEWEDRDNKIVADALHNALSSGGES
jgi:biopolymer transport protein ExbD